MPPYNIITGKNFSINNSIELLVEQLDKNYKTNAWISEKELLKKQLMIKENEKPKEIVVYIQREAIFRKNIKVYNIDQLKISKDQERLFRAPEKYSKTNLKEIDIYSLKKELIKGSLIDFFIKEIKKEKLREKTKGKKIEIER